MLGDTVKSADQVNKWLFVVDELQVVVRYLFNKDIYIQTVHFG